MKTVSCTILYYTICWLGYKWSDGSAVDYTNWTDGELNNYKGNEDCVLYCTVLYCTVLYCTVLYCTVLYYMLIRLQMERWQCRKLHKLDGRRTKHLQGQWRLCPVLYCTVLYCTVLYCTICWLGYKWSDGSAVDYTNWMDGEPNNYKGNEDCTVYWTDDKQWNDYSCYATANFICAIPRGIIFR